MWNLQHHGIQVRAPIGVALADVSQASHLVLHTSTCNGSLCWYFETNTQDVLVTCLLPAAALQYSSRENSVTCQYGMLGCLMCMPALCLCLCLFGNLLSVGP